DIHADNAARVAEGIADTGGRAIAVTFDISDEQSVDELVGRAVRELGRVDGVHANAADLSPETLGREGPPETVPLDVFDRTMALDLRGHLLLPRRVLPEVRAAGGGAIVYTASAAAFSGGTGRSAYSVAKAGLVSLARNVASTAGKSGIRSNVVAPGYVL